MSQSAEEAALRAVLDGDHGQAREILEDFFPSELDDLDGKLDDLKNEIDTVRRMKGAR